MLFEKVSKMIGTLMRESSDGWKKHI